MADYNSEYTGQQIDDAVSRVLGSADDWDDAITTANNAADAADDAVNAANTAYQYINTNFAKVTGNGLLEYDNARVVYLDAMVGIDGALHQSLPAGSTYFQDGKIYIVNSTMHSGGRPNRHTVYISKNTLKNYKWTGSSMQEIQGSGHGFDSTIYTAIKNNMSLLQERLDRLISDLAIMAFQSTATGYKTGVGELTWPDVTQTPLLFVRYNGYNVNGMTVNVTADAGGVTTISFIVKAENIDTGDDFVAELSGGTSLTLVSNTISFAQAKSSNGATLNIIYGQTGETSTTLTVSGNGLNATVVINIAAAGTAKYTVTGILANCTIDGQSSVSAEVTSGGTWTGMLVANEGFTLPDIEDGIITSGTAESVSLVGSTLTIANITSNITFSITATSDQQVSSYVSDDLKLHLDGKDQGTESGCWTDKVSSRRFVFAGNPIVTSDGVTFSTATTEQYGYYSDSTPSWASSTCTVEVCFTPNENYSNNDIMVLLGNRKDTGVGATFYKGFGWTAAKIGTQLLHDFKRALLDGEAITSGSPITLSMNVNLSMLNGVVNMSDKLPSALGNLTSPFDIGMMVGGTYYFDNDTKTALYRGCNATIHEVRIYNRCLDADEMRRNQQYDNIRYNLGLQI